MNIANRKTTWLLTVFSLVLLSGGTALADDTELFLSADVPDADAASRARPNILFVLDTSGSMGGIVKTQASYTKSVDFEGCFNSDRIYYREHGSEAPSCGHSLWFEKQMVAPGGRRPGPRSPSLCSSPSSR
jgi:hypothetical protein